MNIQRGDCNFGGWRGRSDSTENDAKQSRAILNSRKKKKKTVEEGKRNQNRLHISAVNNVSIIIISAVEYLTKTFNVIILRGRRKKEVGSARRSG